MEAIERTQPLSGVALIDLDGTLVAQSAPVNQLVGADGPSGEAISMLADRVWLIVTNRRSAPASLRGIPVMSRARKPWTSKAKLTVRGEPPGCVIGDQLFTDGLLAARLGVPFYRVTPIGRRPWRARLGDRLLERAFGEGMT
ncbi:MAG: hypothetical protein IPM00_09045 [Tetrasphaera sp.]|nr:hypothetical protein [Tetrasphaera sp.]